MFIGFRIGCPKCWGTGKNVPDPRPELGREVTSGNGIAATRTKAAPESPDSSLAT